MFVGIGKSCIFASLFERRVLLKEVWRGGRVVDYSGLENRRTATNKLRKNERNRCLILVSAYRAFVYVLSAIFQPIPY